MRNRIVGIVRAPTTLLAAFLFLFLSDQSISRLSVKLAEMVSEEIFYLFTIDGLTLALSIDDQVTTESFRGASSFRGRY